MPSSHREGEGHDDDRCRQSKQDRQRRTASRHRAHPGQPILRGDPTVHDPDLLDRHDSDRNDDRGHRRNCAPTASPRRVHRSPDQQEYRCGDDGNKHEGYSPEPDRQTPDSVRSRCEQPDRPDPRGCPTKHEQQKKGGFELAEWRQLELHQASLGLLQEGVKPRSEGGSARVVRPKDRSGEDRRSRGPRSARRSDRRRERKPAPGPSRGRELAPRRPTGDGSPRRACRVSND